MTAERREFYGHLAAWHLSGIVGFMPFTGKQLNPDEINPYQKPKPPNPTLEKLAKLRAELKWKAMFGSK